MSIGQRIGAAGRQILEHDYGPDVEMGRQALEQSIPAIDAVVGSVVPDPVGDLQRAKQSGDYVNQLVQDIMSGYQHVPGFSGGAVATPPPPKDEVRPEDLAGEAAFMQQFGGAPPAAGGAAPPQAPPPKAAPPAPTKGPALNARAGMSGMAPGSGMGEARMAEAADARAGAAPPPARNPSAADIRSRLGFSWGKGVKTHDVDGVSRPVEDDLMTLTAPDFTPGVSPRSTVGVSRTPTADMFPDEVLQADHTAGGRREQVHNSEHGGGYLFGSNILDDIDNETAKRRLERVQVGKEPAPETRGELLTEKQRNAYRAEQGERDRAYGDALAKHAATEGHLRARLAAGELTQDQYLTQKQILDEALGQAERMYSMQTNANAPKGMIDPKFVQ